MSDKIVRKVALAALNGTEVDAPEATPQEISLAIMDAHERGLVEASEATNLSSQYPEWILIGPTGLTQHYLRGSRTSKKLWAGTVVAITAIVTFVKWAIPVLISLPKVSSK